MKPLVLFKVLVKELPESLLVILSFHATHLNAIKRNVFIVSIQKLTSVLKSEELKETELCQMELQDLELNKEKLFSILWDVQHLHNTQLSLKFQLLKLIKMLI